MQWIEASLAFAVTMMVFSTIVSVIIETAHRVLRLREKGLKRLMSHIYRDVIQPRLSHRLNWGDGSTARFQTGMTGARFLPVDEQATGLKKWVYNRVNAKEIKSLTTLEFIERLAETPAGKELLNETRQRGRKYLETFLEDLASKYEDFGENAREYFARRARLFSVMTAILVAFVLNVNAIHLFQTFLMDKELRQEMISKGESVAKQLDKQLESQRRELNRTENTEEKVIDASESDQSKPAPPTTEDEAEKIRENFVQLRSLKASINSSGIPIGSETRPWNLSEWQDIEKSQSGLGIFWAKSSMVFVWLISVFLTGILIGLGGPFWFDIFRKLTALTSVARGLQTTVQKAKEEVSETQDKKNLVEIFEKAAKANQLGNINGRVLLTSDGTIDRRL
ncbi:hypothetical protein [Aliikangiella coralliicola]|uniref:Uncharacterized protein n=1 Tax=Aliikangiella coralliicola TaxID=2592383 RepID=A0A545UC85_9GAMM|nr:hypothetical protein [Aliikangiella coralliicola]TQV87074.1 hypothetical protein FLL46_14815 [Aliikangiella coralliicola]